MVDTNEVFIVDQNKNIIHVPITTKKIVAKQIINTIKKYLIDKDEKEI